MEAAIILKFQDRASGPLGRLESKLNKIRRDQEASDRREARESERRIARIERESRARDRAFARQFANINRMAGQGATRVAAGARTVLGAGIGLSALAISRFAAVEQQSRKVGIVAGATAEEQERLNEAARRFGVDPRSRFNALQAAEAMESLATAGLKANDIISVLPKTLALAQAGSIDTATAASFITSSLAGFQLEMSQAERVADTFVAVSNNADTNALQFGEALQYAGAQAHAAGLSIEQTATLVGILANRGIRGSSAGTSLAQAIVNLSKIDRGFKPKALAKLGTDAKEVTRLLNKGDIFGLFDALSRRLDTLDAKTKLAAFNDIFGTRGGKAALNIAQAAKLGQVTDLNSKIISQHGLASENAAKSMDTLAGRWSIVVKRVENLGLRLSDLLIPALDEAMPKIEQFTFGWAEWAIENPKTISNLALTTAGIYGVSTAISTLSSGISILTSLGVSTSALAASALAASVSFSVLGGAAATALGILDKWKNRDKQNDESQRRGLLADQAKASSDPEIVNLGNRLEQEQKTLDLVNATESAPVTSALESVGVNVPGWIRDTEAAANALPTASRDAIESRVLPEWARTPSVPTQTDLQQSRVVDIENAIGSRSIAESVERNITDSGGNQRFSSEGSQPFIAPSKQEREAYAAEDRENAKELQRIMREFGDVARSINKEVKKLSRKGGAFYKGD